MHENELKEFIKQLESQGAVVIVDESNERGNLHIPLDLLRCPTMSSTDREFMNALLEMAKWSIEHPSKSRFEYVSPAQIKANPSLVAAFMCHYREQVEPRITDKLRATMEHSISQGLFPAAVIEHTPDGHHPLGWSWGSEWYIADFYLCLVRALTQDAQKAGRDMNDDRAAVSIAKEAYDLNRINPMPEIIKAMHDRLDEPDETRSYRSTDI
jgi:hypothetical protein